MMAAYLNSLIPLDKELLTKMVMDRQLCRKGFVEHPSIQTADRMSLLCPDADELVKLGYAYVSWLGLLNGFYGVIDDEDSRYNGYGPLQAILDDYMLVGVKYYNEHIKDYVWPSLVTLAANEEDIPRKMVPPSGVIKCQKK